MLQSKQRHIGRSMHRQIIQNSVDPRERDRYPGFDLVEKVDPVLSCPSVVRKRKSFSGGWLKDPKDVALCAARIVYLLPLVEKHLALFALQLGVDDLLTQETFR